MTDELAFYAAHGAITDPGDHASMFAAVTADDGFDFPALRDIYESSTGLRVADPAKGWPKGVETDFAVGLA